MLVEYIDRSLSGLTLLEDEGTVYLRSPTSSARVGVWDNLPVSVFLFYLPRDDTPYAFVSVPFVDAYFLRVWSSYSRVLDYFEMESPSRVATVELSYEDFVSVPFMKRYLDDVLWDYARVSFGSFVFARPERGYYIVRGCFDAVC